MQKLRNKHLAPLTVIGILYQLASLCHLFIPFISRNSHQTIFLSGYKSIHLMLYLAGDDFIQKIDGRVI